MKKQKVNCPDFRMVNRPIKTGLGNVNRYELYIKKRFLFIPYWVKISECDPMDFFLTETELLDEFWRSIRLSIWKNSPGYSLDQIMNYKQSKEAE